MIGLTAISVSVNFLSCENTLIEASVIRSSIAFLIRKNKKTPEVRSL